MTARAPSQAKEEPAAKGAVASESKEPASPADEPVAAEPALLQTAAKQAEPEIEVTTVEEVDAEDLLQAAGNNSNWLTYGRTYDATRFSPLTQINRGNVKKLVPVWSFQTGVLDGFECTPLVIDGVMYLTTPWNHGFAIDAATGREIWHYQKQLPPANELALCCDAVNRGFGAWKDRLYMTTLDAHLVCLDRATGEQIWDKTLADYQEAYSATVAPLVVKDMVLVGISGAEYGIRGFIDAYDAQTGERRWRFYTVPSPQDQVSEEDKPAHDAALVSWQGESWMTGGGSAWVTGTYDPELNMIYWGVGNPSPDFNGDVRPGDNLYTVSIVALDADTGRLKWHYQASPHDVWDYDGVNEPVLVTVERDGRPVKAIVQAHRNGYFYCLERETGKFLYGKPFCEVTWTDLKQGAEGLDPKTGRPIWNPEALPTKGGVRACPGAAGGKEWNPMAINPQLGLAYVPVIENCATFTSDEVMYIKGQPYWGSALALIPNKGAGAMKAIDINTGDIRWQKDFPVPMVAGVLATAGGLVFTGDPDGNFIAFDAENGDSLWNYQCGSGHHASPITYALEDATTGKVRQYVAVASGWGGWTAGFAGEGAPHLTEARGARRGCTLYVFALFEE